MSPWTDPQRWPPNSVRLTVYAEFVNGPRGSECVGPWTDDAMPSEIHVPKPLKSLYQSAPQTLNPDDLFQRGTYVRDGTGAIDISRDGRIVMRYFWQGWK